MRAIDYQRAMVGELTPAQQSRVRVGESLQCHGMWHMMIQEDN